MFRFAPIKLFSVSLLLLLMLNCYGSSEVQIIGSDGVPFSSETNKSSAVISAKHGGYISVGNITLSIPQGAIAEDTRITAELTEIEGSSPDVQRLGKGVKFTPEGLQFLIPAQLEIRYGAGVTTGINESSALIFYEDDSKQLVAIAGTVDKVKHSVRGPIEHFSSYVAAAYGMVAGNTAPNIGGANFLPNAPFAGVPLRVRTAITDVNGGATPGSVVAAFLYYRTVGAPTYNKVSLSPDTLDNTVTNRYFYQIPYNEVTLAGIQYYFEATDNLGVTRTTAPAIRTVPSTASALRLNPVGDLTISAGFNRALTLQASDGGTFRNVPFEYYSTQSEYMELPALGAITRVNPSAIQFSASLAGADILYFNSGNLSGSINVNVVPGLLTSIQITDINQVILNGTIHLGTGQTYDFDVVGFDGFGNKSIVLPAFSTSGGIGSVNVNATGAHFTAGANAVTGQLTADIGGVADAVDFVIYVPPAVAATAPVDGAVGISITPSIGVVFSKVMNTATLIAPTTTACTGTLQVSRDEFVSCVPMTSQTPQFFASDTFAMMTPAVPLGGLTAYKVRVLTGARDSFDYPFASPYTSLTGFTTGPDTVPPTVMISNLHNGKLAETGFIVGMAADNTAATLVEVSFDGGPYQAAIGAPQFRAALPISWREGSLHNISVRARDAVGLYSPAVSIQVRRGSNKDVNGDGYPDFVVGAPSEPLVSSDAPPSGVVRVYYSTGSAGVPSGGHTVASAQFSGPLNSRFGEAVLTADINGDGFADLIVGAPRQGSFYNGFVYVFLSAGSTGLISRTYATASAVLTTSVSGQYFGMSLATADLNGDGVGDLIVGGPYGPNAVHIFHGSPAGIPSGDASSAAAILTAQYSQMFGYRIATGDINGDGYPDIAVGAPSSGSLSNSGYPGKVYIFQNSGSGIPSGADVAAQATLTCTESPGGFGSQLAIGDVNGDGFADLAVSAPRLADNFGKILIYHSPGTSGIVSQTQNEASRVINNVSGRNQFGNTLKIADISGDGYSDLLVGHSGHNEPTLLSRVMLFRSSGATGISNNTDLGANAVLSGPSSASVYGSQISATDFNGDGILDVAVNGQKDGSTGHMLIFHGQFGNGLTNMNSSQANTAVFAGYGEFGMGTW